MFSLILKNCGFHRTFRPFASQVRSYKREVTPANKINFAAAKIKSLLEIILPFLTLLLLLCIFFSRFYYNQFIK